LDHLYIYLSNSCGVVDRNIASKPNASFFAMIRDRSPNLRRLYLSDVVLETPVPESVEFLSVSSSSLWPKCFPPAWRHVAGEEEVTSPRLRVVELHNVKLKRSVTQRTAMAIPDSVERLKIGDNVAYKGPFRFSGEPVLRIRSSSRLRELDLTGCDSLTFDPFPLSVDTLFGRQITTLLINHASSDCLDCVEHLPNLQILEADKIIIHSYLTDLTEEIRYISTHLARTLRHLSIVG